MGQLPRMSESAARTLLDIGKDSYPAELPAVPPSTTPLPRPSR